MLLFYKHTVNIKFSVSDDNSSVQSSPWQRDHSWKQTSPRRNLSKELTFFYCRKQQTRLSKSRKSRRPYSATPELETVIVKSERTGEVKKQCSLMTIVQNLIDKNNCGTPPRAEAVVSPRKRFLREMEKDKVQTEDTCQKRSRSKPVSVATKVGSPVRVNGTAGEETKPTTARNCSYSITSLLAEDRVVKRSPESSPSHFSNAAQAQYCSPPPPPPPSNEDGWYSESVDRLRSIELSVSFLENIVSKNKEYVVAF